MEISLDWILNKRHNLSQVVIFQGAARRYSISYLLLCPHIESKDYQYKLNIYQWSLDCSIFILEFGYYFFTFLTRPLNLMDSLLKLFHSAPW